MATSSQIASCLLEFQTQILQEKIRQAQKTFLTHIRDQVLLGFVGSIRTGNRILKPPTEQSENGPISAGSTERFSMCECPAKSAD